MRPKIRKYIIEDYSVNDSTIYPYELGRVVIPKDDNGRPNLKKDWYVEYRIWNIDLERLVRKRESKGLNKFATVSQRNKAARILKREIDVLLINGAVTILKSRNGQSGIDLNTARLLNAFDFACKIKFLDLEKGTKSGFKSLRKHLVSWYNHEPKYEAFLFKEYTTQIVYQFFDFLSTTIVDTKKKKVMSKKTYNNYVGYLSIIFNFYIDRELIRHNPVTKVKRKKAYSGKHIPYSDDEIERIKKHIIEKEDHQLLLFIQFIYFGFFRPTEELRYLKIDNIKKDTIYIPPEIAKNDRGQHIRIPRGLEIIIEEKKLRDYPKSFYIFSAEGSPGLDHVGQNYFYRRHRKVLDTLGLYGFGKDLYSYKHTGNIRLFKAGADIKTVQEQNRHSSMQQTDTYLRDLGLFRDGRELDIFPDF